MILHIWFFPLPIHPSDSTYINQPVEVFPDLSGLELVPGLSSVLSQCPKRIYLSEHSVKFCLTCFSPPLEGKSASSGQNCVLKGWMENSALSTFPLLQS